MAQAEEPRRLLTPVSPENDIHAHPSSTYTVPRRSQDSIQQPLSSQQHQIPRKKVPSLDHPEVRLEQAPASPASINLPRLGIQEPESAVVRRGGDSFASPTTPESARTRELATALPLRRRPSSGQVRIVENGVSWGHNRAVSASEALQPRIDAFGPSEQQEEQLDAPGLHYQVFDEGPKKKVQNRASQLTVHSAGSSSSGGGYRESQLLTPRSAIPRPASTYTLSSDYRGRALSPLGANGSDNAGSPRSYARDVSASRRSPSSRPMSYIDLLNNVPYHQQVAPGGLMNNANLQSVVGNAASLLDTKKTLEMYRANVKKTTDASVQYEFAIFMINAARDCMPGDGLDPDELILEAKHILQRLADRAYPFAQYYLGDGYFSGLFNKDKPDYDKAFHLFVAASKHGHAEAGYRAALCYEFAWGTTKSYPKAVQFYRNAASKNHPGAATRLGMACLKGDMGLHNKHREGLKWLKRAQESADFQYNSAPYELGLLHLTGFGDDVFKDEAYAAQLLTQSAELGHVEANFMMGQAYENGLYGCPRDAALSVHFYNGAASKGHAEAMMALCAWYMVGAPPVLEKDEFEAYAWAKQAAETGFAKAQYAVGYFTEMGIGCRRDPLEANVWYVRAADQGNETAKQRLAIIRAAASGDSGAPMGKAKAKADELNGKGKKKFMGIF